ncbi:hypothetical protein GQ53DRAFT_128642 [Thozetella sp. PMI_491]|nr:hypothetical protein GQ53DRAFT_128642 [Thozetella sp. PMI_491]
MPNTPYNIRQLIRHTDQLHQRRPLNHSPVSQSIKQVIKRYEKALSTAVFLAEENRLLREEHQRRRQKKEARRQYIAKGGTLTIEEGLETIAQLAGHAGQTGHTSHTGQPAPASQPGPDGPSGPVVSGVGDAQPGQGNTTTQGATVSQTGQKRPRAPPRCSICRSLDHNARSCKNK